MEIVTHPIIVVPKHNPNPGTMMKTTEGDHRMLEVRKGVVLLIIIATNMHPITADQCPAVLEVVEKKTLIPGRAGKKLNGSHVDHVLVQGQEMNHTANQKQGKEEMTFTTDHVPVQTPEKDTEVHRCLIQTLGNVRGAADLIQMTLSIRDNDHLLQENLVKSYDPVLDRSIGKITTVLQGNAEMTNGLEEMIVKGYHLGLIQTLENVRGEADLILLTLAIREHDHLLQDTIVNSYDPVLDLSIGKITTVLQENAEMTNGLEEMMVKGYHLGLIQTL